MSKANQLHEAIARVAAITGVSVGAWHDKATWSVNFSDEASDEQKAAALAVIAAFNTDAPTADDVKAEASRRISVLTFGGTTFGFCDPAGSDKNIAGAGTLALAAIIAGAQPGDLRWADPASDFRWIAMDNTSVEMDAHTCLAFAKTAAVWKTRHIYAARALKDMSPIPADYASDSRWPSP